MPRGRAKSKGIAARRKSLKTRLKSSDVIPLEPAKAPPPICDTPKEPNRRWRDKIAREPSLLNSPSQNNRNDNLRSKTHIGENTERFHAEMGRANMRRNLFPKRSPTHAALEKASEEDSEEKDSTGSGSICETCIVSLRL